LFIRDPKQLTTKKQAELELICQRSETARKTYALTQQFMSMLRLRRGQDFEMWLSAVEASQIPEMRRFAQGLLKDKSAVVAGLTLSYSNGPVEAQVQKRETWSSVLCLAAPNFLCYGNACSMRLDLYRDFR
jgi:transposase